IKKSAVIPKPSAPSFTLSGSVLPMVETYRYLGLPHARRGIDWSSHLLTVTAKASSCLAATVARSAHWPTYARLVIYRTFLRPLVEYGMPALFHALPWPMQRSCHPAPWKPLVEFHNKAMSWITGVPNRYAAASALLGLPSPRDRA